MPDPGHWYESNPFGGAETLCPNCYVPGASSFQDLGAQCFPEPNLGLDWIQIVGPIVAGPGTSDNFFRPPSTAEINVAGSINTADPDGWLYQAFAAATNPYAGANETIRALPIIQFPNGGWAYPPESDGSYQWMQTYNSWPGAYPWQYWRHGQWEYATTDFGVADGGYGSNWEWDSMLVNPGTYRLAWWIQWYGYDGSSTGGQYGAFPGYDAQWIADYTITCPALTGPKANPGGLTLAQLANPTPDEITAASGAHFRENHKLIQRKRLVWGRTLHSRVGTGHTVLVAGKAFYRRHGHRHIEKAGTVLCRAKIGRYVNHRNHHPLLRTRFHRTFTAAHHQRGLTACGFRLPRHSRGKQVTVAMTLTSRHGRAVFFHRYQIR